MNTFLYRLPRFDSNFAVEFLHGTGDRSFHTLGAETPAAIPGRCLNLSDTGLLARFALPLGEGTEGLLRLKPANRIFSLRASVTHTEGTRSGLRFVFRDNQEQQFIRALVEAVSLHTPGTSLA